MLLKKQFLHKTKKNKLIFVIILTLAITSFRGYCDTIDYYQVYYNNVLYKEYNAQNLANPEQLQFKALSIKYNDELVVEYSNDTPCNDCTFYLVIYDIRRKKAIIQTSTIGQANPLTIDLFELVEYSKINKNELFGVFYYEETLKNVRCLFKIKLL